MLSQQSGTLSMSCRTPREYCLLGYPLIAEHYLSNGKIDKKALKAAALVPVAEKSIIEEAKKSEITLTSEPTTAVDPTFYSKDLYDSETPKSNMSTPSIPPPTYHSDASISEKRLAYDALPVLEKEETAWDGYQDDPLPDKTQGKFFRNVRHQVFSLYRRLFGVVFVVNMAILIATVARPERVDAQHLGLIVVSNLFCAILMRQDYVINTFFTVACAVPIS